MNHLKYLCLLCLLLFTSACGESPAVSQPAPSAEVQLTPSSTPSNKFPESVAIAYTEKDSLSYKGFEVNKRYKMVEFEGVPNPERNSYAILMKNGKVLKRFEGLDYPLGNLTDFGLFSFLGGDDKQLVVEQSIHKGWRHWIVDLSSEARIIFDSSDYGVSYELNPIDIDGDGTYEFLKTIATFDYFDGLCHACSPLIPIVFKYDAKEKKYLPANQIFQEYALDGIDEYKAKVELVNKALKPADLGDRMKALEAVLEVSLRYIYAGKESDGWAFYDREYKLPDREETKLKIRKELEDDPVYKFLYAKGAI